VDYFNYVRGELHCEGVPASTIAREVGTPAYVYSTRTVLEHYRKLRRAFEGAGRLDPPLICYSVKANSNLSLMKLMLQEGAGFDVVSGGELFRALRVGAPPRKIVMAGVGKSEEELREAIGADILMINAESEGELARINRLAGQLGRRPQVALRINPDVDPKTHRYTTTGKKENKFGINLDQAEALLGRQGDFPNLVLRGLHVHIGSQITAPDPYVQALGKVRDFLARVRAAGARIDLLDVGGGFGIWYKDKAAPPAETMAEAMIPLLAETGCRILMEPGRFIVGNAGILLTRVQYVKQAGDRRIVICDAGMNDLIRPSLYEAYHRVWPVATADGHSGEPPDEASWGGPALKTDVVGPICETGDFLALDRSLPEIKPGELLAVFSAGAYGYAMASNYNSHPRPAEVLVAADRWKVATRRESYDDLVRNEEVVSF
jgi:diaminopimelate decarboxylase